MESFIKKNIRIIGGLPYEEIGDVIVGTATTQVDFTGLNIGKDDELLLVSDIKNATTTSNISLQLIANNVSATSHYVEVLYALNTTVGSGRENNAKMGELFNSANNFFYSKIKLTNNGYFIHQSEEYYGHSSPTNSAIEKWYCSSTVTLTSITSLKITASTANSIGISSRFQLYKLVAEKVADIIVSTATTSVDITGLNIGKDGEYRLVSDFNGLSSNNDTSLYFNNNTTSTNYYTQVSTANGTLVEALRNNTAIFSYLDASKVFSITNIKLTNSGYVVQQTSSNRFYGGATLRLVNNYSTSTFTTSEITSLRISGAISNGIGIGSRFQLYRIK